MWVTTQTVKMESEGPDYNRCYVEINFRRESANNHLVGGRLLKFNNTTVIK